MYMAEPAVPPFFSVVIPTYNRPQMLKDAVETVLNQTFQDFEIIIVDDHSENNVNEIVEQLMDPRVQLIKNKNRKGACGARNTGVEHARSNWIKFLDDDDAWEPDMLAAVRKKIDQNSSFGLIYTDYERRNFKNNEIIPRNRPQKYEGWVFDNLTYINFVGGFSFVAIKKEVLLDNGLLDESMPAEQDWELYLRLAKKVQFGFIDRALGYYRRDNSDNISKSETNRVKGLVTLYKKNRKDILTHKQSWLRISYRISKAAFLSRNWKVYFSFLPNTLFGIAISKHNALKLFRGLAGLVFK